MQLSSIRARVLIAALLPALVAIVVGGGLLVARQLQQVERVSVEQALSLARQTASMSELALATASESAVDRVLEFARHAPTVQGLTLQDASGRPLGAHGHLTPTALRMLNARPFIAQIERDAHAVNVIHPVTALVGGSSNDRVRVGFVALSYGLAQERAGKRDVLITGILISLGVILLAVLLAHLTSRALAAPLSRLGSHMAAVAHGRFDTPLPVAGRGELRQLAIDYNAMLRALAAARGRLQAEIDQAVAALDRRTREAEAASQSKSRFLAAASHDLRQPAHALSLYVAALRQGLRSQPAPVAEALSPAVEGVHAASRSLERLLNAVLDISRFDAGVVPVERRPVELSTLVREAALLAESAAREKGLLLRVRATPLTLSTDAVLLRRVLDNLLSNAIRHSRTGRILVALRRRGGGALIQVWDQGVGIASEHLPHLFEEFYQVRRGESAGGGLGLGLAIAARAAELIGGRISVRSVPGRGSCFAIVLDGNGQATESVTETRTIAVSAARGETIAVLDDDALVRDSLALLLRQHGYRVIAAGRASELSSALQANLSSVAAALVDYRLEDGYTGIDAARRIERLFARHGRQITIVLITGDTSAERIRALHESGFAVLHKPVQPVRLLELLASGQHDAGVGHAR